MSVMLARRMHDEPRELRSVYCEVLIELAEDNKDIVILDSDLMSAMGIIPFMERFPARTINVGIMEANMMGVAAGLSARKKIPFAHTFACFASRRAFDQIFLSGGYAQLNVKVVGSDPGITATMNGGTHMSFEDMGLMRAVPNMDVVEPTDAVMLKSIIQQFSKKYGMQYLRLLRRIGKKIYEEGSQFEIGKGIILREGNDVTIISSGFCVAQALKAADQLQELDISARVVDMFTWKPIDSDLIIESAIKTGAVVTAENHRITNGLGSAVADVLVRNRPVPVEMIGVGAHEFGEVGPLDYLAARYKLNAPDIVEAVKKVLQRKA